MKTIVVVYLFLSAEQKYTHRLLSVTFDDFEKQEVAYDSLIYDTVVNMSRDVNINSVACSL